MTLKELRQQRSQKATRGKAATTEYNALAAKADRTEAEETQLAALDAELTALEAEVTQLDASIAREEATSRRGALFATAGRSVPAGAGARTIAEPDPERTGGYRHLADFAVSVRNAQVGGVVDPRLTAAAPANFHQNGGSSGEGYLVPPEFSQTIWSLTFDGFSLLSAVSPEPTNSNVVGIVKDESTPWGASGVQAQWRTEGGKMDASKLGHAGELVSLHELYAFVVASDELLSDAPRLNNRLTVKASEAIRWKASDSIAWGDGVGKPKGFMLSEARVTVAKDSGQAAKTITPANVANQYARMLASGGGRGAFWLANSDILPQLMVMTIGNQLIWTPPSAGFAEAPGGFLLGLPIQFSEHAQTLGTEGDLTLVNPDGYYAATKEGGGIDFASSIHLFFDYGLQAFRWTFRLGGQPIMSAPVAPPRSGATKSHFVTLANRA